jgi:hypothetical protein
MPGCVLHVRGEDFDVDAFLADSGLRPYRVHHRGEPSRSGSYPHGGFSLVVSDVNGDLNAEIADATTFLSAHEAELLRLHGFSGVSDMRLDFGYYRRDVAGQFEYLPPQLLALAGRCGIGIELSLYATPHT